MSSGLPINVSPANPNWRPDPAQLIYWKTNCPAILFKADASNPDWVDSNGNAVSTMPISLTGFAVYEWRIVAGGGQWVEIVTERRCRSGCSPDLPLPVPGVMPLGMRIAKPCR
jgi:hypothetical protein